MASWSIVRESTHRHPYSKAAKGPVVSLCLRPLDRADGADNLLIFEGRAAGHAVPGKSYAGHSTNASDSQFFSEVALEAGLMKDAWRNHVLKRRAIIQSREP
jgi:hypothetical protein